MPVILRPAWCYRGMRDASGTHDRARLDGVVQGAADGLELADAGLGSAQVGLQPRGAGGGISGLRSAAQAQALRDRLLLAQPRQLGLQAAVDVRLRGVWCAAKSGPAILCQNLTGFAL